MQYVVKVKKDQPNNFDPSRYDTVVRGWVDFGDDLTAARVFMDTVNGGTALDAVLYVRTFGRGKPVLVEYRVLRDISLAMLDHDTAPVATVGIMRPYEDHADT